MMIPCPHCQHQLRGADRFAGKNVKCPKCGQQFICPSQSVEASASQSEVVTATVVSPQSYGVSPYRQSPKNSGVDEFEGRSKPWVYGCIVLLVALLIPFLAGIFLFVNYMLPSPSRMKQKATTPVPLVDHAKETYTTPSFPELPAAVSVQDANVYTVRLGKQLTTWSSDQPAGVRTQIRVYVPADLTQDKKVPCILVAAAGSNLLHGKQLDDLTYTDEVMPYVDAGMIAIQYSQDGNGIDQAEDERQELSMLPGCFKEFSKANGGVTNGQIALDFALEKFSQIDRERIYCAGHSSAGTISLQLASTDSRISRCIAYAPAPSLTKRFAEILDDPSIHQLLPGLRTYIDTWSPDQRISRFHCPIFIFQARDDSNTPYRDTKQFCDAMKAAEQDVELFTTPRGGHYQSMIDEGIPAAIQWLQRK